MAGRRCLQRIVLLNLFFIQQVNAINFSKTIVVISLKTKSLVISKGGKENEQTQNGILTGNVIMNYFSVNTALDLKFPIKDKFIPYLSFGPRFDNSLFDNNILSNFKSTSIGLIFGGGLKFDLNKYQLGLRYDYYQDFTKLVDTYGISRYQRAFDINMTLGYKLK